MTVRRPGPTAALAFGLVAFVMVAAGCGLAASQQPVSFPPGSVGPEATVTGAVGQTRVAIAAALAASNIQLQDTTEPYRTAEPRGVAAAPRAVYQAILPDDPDGGFIVVYEFRDTASAVDAGNELAGYLGTGVGRIQYPTDARHTIRQVGTTLIHYTWAPSTSPDATSARVADALAGLGIGFAPPR
ncbi:MAG TPA: hypothetical protein VFT20_13855 [Candidatus Limnocylindrales bacterium]|nr:hypothetical protein [Candidatus Limnocylindrales bacterium]